MLEYRVRGVARGECSAIDLMKRKEAIVLREERATRASAFSPIPALSPRSFLSPVVAFNGHRIQSSGERLEGRDQLPGGRANL